ncbi:CaiB/BaiF CoA transferase family protein [Oceanospirillum linum]|uniref:CoA transferase n=1 Tax=Oceanospirillum linum TaxID=966 RepID=A0A1T1HBI4_OCELI|nr:CaiB/BaiF CoA-transferase family protein [Oceanospirillum linum]OOV87087.1 CoA transferase [Oceanospirillum linum]
MGALSHVRVLDMSRILAGPWAGQVLADLGADVIKIERPLRGDDTRSWGPPWMPVTHDPRGEAAYYLCANRSKRSLALDITSPQGQGIIRSLAAESDILLENYKVGGLKKYGLDYESLKAVNPRLIYCSITGFGQDGPYAKRAGYDFLIQAMSGLMSITGEKDGRPGAGPQKVGVALTDILTGMYATTGVLAALASREQTGQGQYIDIALMDVQVACLANQAMNYLVSGNSPTRLGNAHPNIVPYQSFKTADGYMVLAVGNDAQFAKFCQEAGKPNLAQDERFMTNAQRVANREVLLGILEPLIQMRTTLDWITALEALSVPCGPINNIGEAFDDPQIKARQMQVEIAHEGSENGRSPSVANPLKMSGTPITYEKPAPLLGEHTRKVLEETGLTVEQIEQLLAKGVISER